MFLDKHRPKMAPKPLESRLEIKCKSSQEARIDKCLFKLNSLTSAQLSIPT